MPKGNRMSYMGVYPIICMKQTQKDTEHVQVWRDVQTELGCECGGFFTRTVHAETGANFYIEEMGLCHNCKATINLQSGEETGGIIPRN